MRFFLLIFLFTIPLLASAQKYQEQMKDTIYKRVDEAPSFPNGDSEMYDYIEENLFINVPSYQLDRMAENGYYVLLKFIVDSQGEIQGVSADERSRDFYLQDWLEEIFYDMPQWQPGKVNRAPVNTLVYLELDITVENGTLNIRYHPLFPDSVTWTKRKMTKKQKMWGIIAAVAITGLFLLISSGKLSF